MASLIIGSSRSEDRSAAGNGRPCVPLHSRGRVGYIKYVVLLMLLAAAPGAEAATRYVRAGATGANDGTNWTNAHTSLSAALTAATNGDEVWVAAGTYYPTTGTDRLASFVLKNGVKVYGGFPGAAGQEDNFAVRNLAANPTILSGDIAGQNSHHVINANGTNSSAVLDGFTIRDGTSNGDPGNLTNVGGGMICAPGSPTIVNCVFRNNSAYLGGGAYVSGTARFINCVFHGNSTIVFFGAGGAIYADNAFDANSGPVLDHCTVVNNSANERGGGLAIDYGGRTMTVRNSILWGNTAPSDPQAVGGVTAVVAITNSNVQGGYAGAGNVNFDPLFVDSAGGNFRLQQRSASINAANAATLPADISDSDGDNNTAEAQPIDADGAARIVGAAADLGAFEQASPLAPPSAPTGLAAMTISPNRIDLDWADNNPAPASYSVYRGLDAGFTPSVATRIATGLIASAHINTGLDDGIPYFYRVTALDAGGGESLPSNEATAITQSNGTILYVRAAAAPGGDGSSWANAYRELQSALPLATGGDQVWIAVGTYMPDFNTNSGLHDADRNRSFVLNPGVTVIGGFSGAPGTEGNVNARATDPDPTVIDATVETVLSGDIGTNGAGDNSFHVVATNGVLPGTTLLKGVTITAGRADGANPANKGGAIYLDGDSLNITDCQFISNYGADRGGALHTIGGSPRITNCRFIGNATTPSLNQGGFGAGAYVEGSGTAVFTGCTFTSNVASFGAGIEVFNASPRIVDCLFKANNGDNGAGLSLDATSAVVIGCTFEQNSVQFYNVGGCSSREGAAVRMNQGAPRFTNCIFKNNVANNGPCGGGRGGALMAYSGQPRMYNCLIVSNFATDQGGGIYLRPGATIQIVNSTIVNNGAAFGNSAIQFSFGTGSILDNSIIYGNGIGATDVAFTPRHCLFENADYNTRPGAFGNISVGGGQTIFGPDYSLVSQYRNLGSNALLPADLEDLDADTNTAEPLSRDLYKNTRVADTTVDMGAVEFQPPQEPIITQGATASTVVCNGSNCNAEGNLLALSATDANGDANTLNWAVKEGTQPLGAVSFVGGVQTAASVTICYTPAADFEGIENFIIEVVDAQNLRDEIEISVNVSSGVNPTFTGCPFSVAAFPSAGQCSAQAFWTPPTARDNCGIVSATSTHNPGDVFPVGTTSVTYTATDTAGLTGTCTFNVIVYDPAAPVIQNCPGDITVNVDSGQCSAVVTWDPITASDDCSLNIFYDFNYESGDTFPIGTSYVYVLAQDDFGNASVCDFAVTVTDNQPPVLENCPEDISTQGEFGNSVEPIYYALPTALDPCPGTQLSCFPPPGSYFPYGTTTVNCKATDANGQMTVCSFDVNISDGLPPEWINCPADRVVQLANGDCSTHVSWSEPFAVDDNDPTVPTSKSHNPGDLFPPGVTEVVYTATDSQGNVGMCAFTITVVDPIQPQLGECPGDQMLTAEPGACGAVATWTPPTYDDNCPGATLTSNYEPGDLIPVGDNEITYMLTDAGGNQLSCSFFITVTDDQPPQLADCPADINTSAAADACGAVVTWTPPTAIDNCPNALILSDHEPGDTFPVGTTPVTYTAVDASSNATTCSFNVTVTDDAGPVVTCPADAEIAFGADTSTNALDVATAVDNCIGPVAPTFADTELPGQCPFVKVIERRWSAADALQNDGHCMQVIRVLGPDTDADGTVDCADDCPNDPNKTEVGLCGCGLADTDSDSDGTPDCADQCPNDADKIAPGECGCGTPDTDSDGDGAPDCSDGCPTDPSKPAPGPCGCGIPETDLNTNGQIDCEEIDLCPDDPDKTNPGSCGCGIPETDSDGDGLADCLSGDNCPDDPDKTLPGLCGCGTPETDTDGDLLPDCVDPDDGAPNEPPGQVSPNMCGTCGAGSSLASALTLLMLAGARTAGTPRPRRRP